MKQTFKSYLFCNFSNKNFSDEICKDRLKISESLNIDCSKNKLYQRFGYYDYFLKKFDKLSDFELFFNENREILQKIKLFKIYKSLAADQKNIQNRYFLITENLKFYEVDFYNKNITFLNYEFKELPSVFNDENSIYFYDGETVLIVNGMANPQLFDGVCQISAFDKNNDLVFFSLKNDNYKIYFQESTDLINLSEDTAFYDSIKLNIEDGKLVKFFISEDRLYVFQEYKILVFVLSASGVKNDFEINLNSKIIQNTVCQINEEFLFLTTAGFKVFNKHTVQKIFAGLTNNIDFIDSNFKAVVYKDKYYCISKMKIDNDFEPVIVELEPEEQTTSSLYLEERVNDIFLLDEGGDVEFGAVIGSGQTSLVTLYSGTKTNLKKFVRFNKIYFDSGENKQINRIKFIGKGELDFKVVSDIDEMGAVVCAGSEWRSLMIRGHIFQFEISATSEFELESILVEVMSFEDNL